MGKCECLTFSQCKFWKEMGTVILQGWDMNHVWGLRDSGFNLPRNFLGLMPHSNFKYCNLLVVWHPLNLFIIKKKHLFFPFPDVTNLLSCFDDFAKWFFLIKPDDYPQFFFFLNTQKHSVFYLLALYLLTFFRSCDFI